MGGFETDHPHPLSYEAQAKWTMQYVDRRFRKDLHFMFQIFRVIQKHQVCQLAVLQVQKKAFHDHELQFLKLTPQDLIQASKEEEKKQTHSDPTVRALKHYLNVVRSKVMGTDESRTQI